MSMNHILDEPEQAEITLYDVLLYNQWSCKNEEKDDVLFITYRDADGKKKVQQIKRPSMEIYFVKPEFRTFNTPREYLPIDQLYSAKIPAKNVLNRIYNELKTSSDKFAKHYATIYEKAAQLGEFRMRKEVLKWPYTLMSDMNVTEYYWVQLGYHYNTMHSHIIDKCFLDIENDIFKRSNSEIEANMDPVNAVTIIFHFDEKGEYGKRKFLVYTYLLRDYKRYPQQEEFERNIKKFEETCHKEFDVQTVIKEGKVKEFETKADYRIELFDTEQELLRKIFETINTFKPDLCEIWNIAYDMPKMYNRMINLGMDPAEVMSDHDYFPRSMQFVQMHIDNRAIDIANRNSYIRMTSTTQYIDDMQNYAGIRKGRKSYGSNKLDNIAKIELGMGKRKFKKGVDVTNACIYDYWNFVLYNIRDVWCQTLIDIVTNDTMAIVYDMNQQNCPLYHLTKQTRYQKYIYYCWYLRKGFVPGNNVNVNYSKFGNEDEQERVHQIVKNRKIRSLLVTNGIDDDDVDQIMSDPELLQDTLSEFDIDVDEFQEDTPQTDNIIDEVSKIAKEEVMKTFQKYQNYDDIFRDSISRKLPLPGGAVGNPDFNDANGVELIPGVKSKHVFRNAMDEDYSSEYPWAKFTRSLSRSTQIGRLIIPEKISDKQFVLPLGQQKRAADIKTYIPGAEFTSDYISQDYLSFGECWFNLPSVEEMSKIIDKELGIQSDESTETEELK